MKTIKILIADDNKLLVQQLEMFFEKKESIELIKSVYNGKDALESIQNSHPDLVLLDLVMPLVDGIGVLEELQRIQFTPLPNFIILSGITLNEFTLKALKLGASYYVVKPFSFDNLYNRILSLINLDNNENIKRTITKYLNLLRISPSHLGHTYLKDAIYISLESSNSHIQLIDIIIQISKIHNVSIKSVERAMNNSIESSLKKCNPTIYEDIFGHLISVEKGKPTIKEFINLITEHIKQEIT